MPELLGERVFHYSIPVLQETGNGQEEDSASIQSAKIVLKGGEVLVSRLNPRKGLVLRAQTHDVPTVASSEFVPLVPRSAEADFVRYAFQAHYVRAYLSSRAQSATRSHQRCAVEVITRAPILWPPLERQRVIVRFLDEETAEIDDLIEKKSHLHALLLEEADAFLTLELWPDPLPDGWSMTPLMRLTQPSRPIMYGIVLPGPNVPEGVPLVKGGDVSNNRMHPNLLNKTTLEIEAPYARARLSGGDVLLTIRGRYGDAALVPEVMSGANITQDIARIAPRPEIDSKWLLRVLQCQPIVRKMFNEALGAAVQGVNIRDVKRYQVPLLPPAEQGRLASEIDDRLTTIEEAANSLAQATARLREYRSALITAAVTGQIDVGSAA